MKIRVLGSGGWEGIPHPFCKCDVCKTAIKNPNGKDFRFRPCIEVNAPEGTFLIECPPDIRMISQKFNLPYIKDYFISHWHYDHAYGLLELDATSRRNPITVRCSENTKEWITGVFPHITMNVIALEPFETVALNGAKITPFPVYHMWQRDKDLKDSELRNTFGFLIDSGKKKLAYTADFYRIPKKSLALIKGVDVLITEGTYLLRENVPKEEDTDHLHGQQILDLAKQIGAKDTYLFSITHLCKKTHAELSKALPKNIQPSWDGMEIQL